MALFATVAGVRYCWRHKRPHRLRGTARHRARARRARDPAPPSRRRLRRRGASWCSRASPAASPRGSTTATAERRELADARAINLTSNDLPNGWYTSSSAPLNYLVPPRGQRLHVDDDDGAAEELRLRSCCRGLSRAASGSPTRRTASTAQPVSSPTTRSPSPIFNTNSLGGIELASTAQYYHTTTMVRKDTARDVEGELRLVLHQVKRDAHPRGLRREESRRARSRRTGSPPPSRKVGRAAVSCPYHGARRDGQAAPRHGRHHVTGTTRSP